MAHVRPPGRASRTAMRQVTDIDISLTLRQAQNAGLNIDEGDVEEFYRQASCDRNLWVEVCTLLKAGNYAGLAGKAANVTHVEEVNAIDRARADATKQSLKPRRPIRMCRLLALLVKIATIQFEGQANLYGVWLYHGHGKDRRANVSLH